MTLIFSLAALTAALSVDALTASFAYGAEKIKIPFSSVLVISVVCSSAFALSLLLGGAVTLFITETAAKWISFSILALIALTKLFSSTMKLIIKKLKTAACRCRPIRFTMFNLTFFLCVCDDFKAADRDSSKTLSAAEAFALAAALSIDGLAAGFGAGIGGGSFLLAVLLSLLLTGCAVVTGDYLGKLAAVKSSLDLSWIGGAALLVLAFAKLW